jgi:hypothetical protein
MKAMLENAGLKYIASYSSSDMSIPVKLPKPGIERNIVVAARQ